MEIILEVFGWVGGILLSICGAPIAWESYRDGHSDRVNMLFLKLWFWGEVFVLIYVFPKFLIPLIANYAFNIVLILVILYYKKYPRTVN